ncbi:helix-turn-helix domain-containing protein [uncultured Draconibacterium sp.]|uniref:helix-turn-helix domain-containing protein n=1 Tax=uncultured Draconibacterium sp. TaxID=1573823 RepID=UPI0025CD6CB6|nr:helix-turn-helix domain-containing protein [uncultured Draconibacterium sp.]
MGNLSSKDNEFLSQVYQNIDENLGDELYTVEKLSEAMNISRSMLHRKLKRLIGKSATEIITEKRLDKAKDLLEKSNLTSAEIAYKTGFNSPSYFNKVFKKHYQISPGEVRKGKKVVISQQFGDKTKVRRKIKWSVLIFVFVLLATFFTWAGLHFFKGETDRSEISIAILPFDSLSEIENTQYFADGVMEDLLNRLSTIKEIKVISRTSSEMFRDKGEKTVPEIGKLLGASHVVEGSVQRVKDNIRISIQLIDAKTDNHVLSKQYDRNLSDFFSIQSEIASKIASELSLALTNTELASLKKEETKSVQAFELYRLGRFHSSKRRVEELLKGIEYYEKALEIDTEYAQAYAGLADNYYLLTLYSPDDRKARFNKSNEMAEKALEIDPDLAEAHTVVADINKTYKRKWKEAEKEFQKALEVKPNYSTAHQYYAELLSILGRNDEAREHIDKAMQLDPFSIIIRYQSARFYYDMEQFDEALKDIQVCLDLDSEFIRALSLEFDIYLASKNDFGVLECMRRSTDIIGLWSKEQVDSVYQAGGIDEIKRWVTSLQNFEPKCTKAIFYAMLGEYENAMDMLEIAYETGYLGATSTTFLEYKPLRSNPRFMAIREKMGLPQLEP